MTSNGRGGDASLPAAYVNLTRERGEYCRAVSSEPGVGECPAAIEIATARRIGPRQRGAVGSFVAQ
ncbi:hypothetical protein ACNSTU_16135 [Aquisalimonas sp. APHAB1-3]|uniref:hypothetical protein n=1 Tax=Aquisalimonas sp. APHAB1-3 TaxID=3402080 RepID=UPI003AAFADA9